MDFIRNNIGLVVYCGVWLLLVGALSLGIRQTKDSVVEAEEKLSNQQQFFERVQRSDVSLTEENLEIARKNRTTVEDEMGELLTYLRNEYAIRVEPQTRLKAVRTLKDACRRFHQKLEDEDVIVGDQCSYFSFGGIATSAELPPEGDVEPILKQIQIIEDVVTHVSKAYLAELRNIERPNGLQPLEEEFYNRVPLIITVGGTLNQVQAFVNKIQMDSEYLFSLQHLELNTDNRTTDLENALSEDGTGRGRDGGRGGARGGRGGRMDDIYRPDDRTGDGQETMEEGRPRSREARLVYGDTPHHVVGKLYIDFIEFTANESG